MVSSGSGNGLFVKGDVTTKEFKIEAKRTDNTHSISLKREWLTKVAHQAFSERRLPAVAIEFGGSTEQFYVLRASEFQLLLSLLRE